MLAEIGYAMAPGDIVARWRAGDTLTKHEQQLLVSHSKVAEDLLGRVPRLDRFAAMVGNLGSSGTSQLDSRVALVSDCSPR